MTDQKTDDVKDQSELSPLDKSKPLDKLNPLEKLRETFREEVDELVQLELDVEELAERKAGLLKAYLKDDIHGAKQFWLDLKAEANTLEEFVGDWLLKAANPTSLDWMKIKQYIEIDEDQRLSGELVSDLELTCVCCGKIRLVEEEIELPPCRACGYEMFKIR
ncbi:MAG: zinc ribbon-containing protein [Cellvibrionaceae bacterium]